MTLHQGQGHRNEHEHILLYAMHAKFGCRRLNTVRDMAVSSTVQV